jgi:hypothetical protein
MLHGVSQERSDFPQKRADNVNLPSPLGLGEDRNSLQEIGAFDTENFSEPFSAGFAGAQKIHPTQCQCIVLPAKFAPTIPEPPPLPPPTVFNPATNCYSRYCFAFPSIPAACRSNGALRGEDDT